MMACVTDNGAINGAFAVTNGVMQGCVPAPALFPLMFSSMLMDAYCDGHPGARIAYRTNGHLLNSRRMPSRTMISPTTVHDLLVADDCGLSSAIEVDMQRSMDLLTDGWGRERGRYCNPKEYPSYPDCRLTKPLTSDASIPVDKLAPNQENPENINTRSKTNHHRFWDSVRPTALAVLGRARTQHQDPFDEDNAANRLLLAEMNRLRGTYLYRPTDAQKSGLLPMLPPCAATVTRNVRPLDGRKVEEIQTYADHHDSKNVFAADKVICGSPTKGKASLLSSEGSTLLTKKSQILKRRAEHLRNFLSRPSIIAYAAIDRLPQMEINVDQGLCSPFQKPVAPGNNSPAGKQQAPTQSHAKSTNSAAIV
nr:unnamed protein product [Spirometra erinaceieuropaei]